MQTTQKSEKTIISMWKNVKKSNFAFKTNTFLKKKGRESGDTRIFSDFRFCGSVVVILFSKVISCYV